MTLSREVLIAGRPPELISFSVESEPPYAEGTPLLFNVEASDSDVITYSFDFDGDGVFDIVGDDPRVRYRAASGTALDLVPVSQVL